MATLTRVRRSKTSRADLARMRHRIIKSWMPRRCTVMSCSLILAGLAIPLLMAVKVVPITLPLGFTTLVLLGVGCSLLLIRCGEI